MKTRKPPCEPCEQRHRPKRRLRLSKNPPLEDSPLKNSPPHTRSTGERQQCHRRTKNPPSKNSPLEDSPTPAEGHRDERGVYAPFIAIIAVALILLSSIAYDAPRIIAARQDVAHAASEAARVAAVTIASGGSLADARRAAEERVGKVPLVYGEAILVASVDCVGSWIEVLVVSGYRLRSALRLGRERQPLAARGAAEAVLIRPDGSREQNIKHLGECPIISSVT